MEELPIYLRPGRVVIRSGTAEFSEKLEALGLPVRSPAGVNGVLLQVCRQPNQRVYADMIPGNPATVSRHISETCDILLALRKSFSAPAITEVLARYTGGGGRGGRNRNWCRYSPEGAVSEAEPEALVHPEAGLRMIYVPGGTYRRGREHAWATDERPEHGARLSPHFLSDKPVSNAQYATFQEELAAAFRDGVEPATVERRRAWIIDLGRVWEAMAPHIRDADLVGRRRRLRWPRGPEEGRGARDLGASASTLSQWDEEQSFFATELCAWLEPGWDHRKQSADAVGVGEPSTGHRSRYDPVAVREANHPVVGLDWLCMHAYCLWYGLQLPPEAVWEHAALGARKVTFRVEAPNRPTHGLHVSALGDFPSNVGVLGMLGNCWEWTADFYAPYRAYGDLPVWDPVGPAGPVGAAYRAIRGGAFETEGIDVGPTFRGANQMLWRAPWDTLRPYAPLDYATIARIFGLPRLDRAAAGALELLLQPLDPPNGGLSMGIQTPTDRYALFVSGVRVAARAPTQRSGAATPGVDELHDVEDTQATLLELTTERVVHRNAAYVDGTPGLRQLADTAACAAQSAPCGGFAWIDDLNGQGRRRTKEKEIRLTFCAWSRVPGYDELLLVESHARIDGHPEAAEIVLWLQRLGWPDRRGVRLTKSSDWKTSSRP